MSKELVKTSAKNLSYKIHIQYAENEQHYVPARATLRKWVQHILLAHLPQAEINLRIVAVPEMSALNEEYRQKKGATNVLSFPFEIPAKIKLPLPILGDVVVCAVIVNQEAVEQRKPLLAHWAHLITHGTLHLLGYDHHTKKETIEMETQEIKILSNLGFKNPYEKVAE